MTIHGLNPEGPKGQNKLTIHYPLYTAPRGEAFWNREPTDLRQMIPRHVKLDDTMVFALCKILDRKDRITSYEADFD